MGYVDENLMTGESVVYSARLHRFMFVLPALLFVIGVLIAVSGRGEQEEFACVTALGAFLILGAILVFVIRLVEYHTSEFAVTTKRLIIKAGLVHRRTLELLLSKVETVGVDQSIPGRLLGFGTIVVTGTGGTKEPFSNIAEPMEFRRHVQEQTAGGVTSASDSPAPSSPPAVAGGAFCSNCGAKNVVGANFCASCGNRFTPV
jgi:uncharacterized membrane protein YdbT with pleckstrin-like domain